MTSRVPATQHRGARHAKHVGDTIVKNADQLFSTDLRRQEHLRKKAIGDEVAQNVTAVGTTPCTVHDCHKRWNDLHLKVCNLLLAQRTQGMATGGSSTPPIHLESIEGVDAAEAGGMTSKEADESKRPTVKNEVWMLDAAPRLQGEDVTNKRNEVDLRLAGRPDQVRRSPTLVEMGCRFGFLDYQWLQGMTFAIEEINSNPDLLPNTTLGFWMYDSCRVFQKVMEGTLWMLTGRDEAVANYRCLQELPLAGIIGDSGSTPSILMARVLGLYRIPQISYFSTNPILSDRKQFPSFFRTIPTDDYQSRGLAQLVIHFGWTWVGLLAEDSDYGQQGIQIVKQEVINAGVCVAFSENVILSRTDRNAFHVVQVIKNSTAKAIVVFCLDADLAPVLDEMVWQNVTGKIWIASEAWSTSKLLSERKYWDILAGTIGFAIHSGAMPGFDQYLNNINPTKYPEDNFTREFWEEAFVCTWSDPNISSGLTNNNRKPCMGDEKLDSLPNLYDGTNLRVTYNTYLAVYAIAISLQDMLSCRQNRGPFIHGSCADSLDFHPWQLLHYVKNVHFKTKAGAEFDFDINGRYDIVNWQMNAVGAIHHVKVGNYDSSATENLKLNTSTIQWKVQSDLVPRSVCTMSCSPGYYKVTMPSKPACCFQCVQCSQGDMSNQTDSIECIKCPLEFWPAGKQDRCIPKITEFLSSEEYLGIVLTATGILFSSIPSVILGLFIHFRNTPIVKANNRSLSYLLLLSLTLCFLSSLTFIGYPTQEKCLLRQAAFGISFALCVSCILAKTTMVVIAFNATKPNSDLRRWIGPQMSYLVVCISTLIQVLLCILWLSLSPPFCEKNTQTEPGKIIIQCNEGSLIAFWCMLGYLGLLAFISFIVAFLARKLPDSFNEAQFITFSMLAFLSVWLSFIPAYLSTRGKYMVAMEIFAIQSSSSALLSCIFFPKCYIILVKPELNTKEHLMGRDPANIVH
ncbi:extracellular calcium-sensing receptor-like [Ambystoma mexicanum]|uniref:extracellular calcium-sensing receptor-like n=1 Tax=Ambystoma mexicanum TaxID=8296 RepID=UPI0037E7A566